MEYRLRGVRSFTATEKGRFVRKNEEVPNANKFWFATVYTEPRVFIHFLKKGIRYSYRGGNDLVNGKCYFRDVKL